MLLTPSVRAELVLSLPATPEVLRSGDIDFFAHTPDSKRNNRVSIFYATPCAARRA
jgi:hypothetical protein